MIIQVAGTSGSGKSHLMRSFLKWARKDGGFTEHPLFAPERASPIAYLFKTQQDSGTSAVVLGAYESPTGGCDTIHDIAEVFKQVAHYHEHGDHVLFEGLFCMNQTRGPQLASYAGKDLVVLQLTTPLATCLASINARRAERGEGELATTKNTINNYKRAENYCARMRDGGARVVRISREQGLEKILELLREAT